MLDSHKKLCESRVFYFVINHIYIKYILYSNHYEVNRVMEIYDLNNKLWRASEKVNYLYKKMYFSKCIFEKLHYRSLLNREIENFNSLSDEFNERKIRKNRLNDNKYTYNNREIGSTSQREFTIEELANFDGSMGRPAYVAINGIVYDVSLEKTWGGATHFGLIAGKDLTGAFQGCHGNIEILRNLPKVGVLKREQ